MRVAYLLKTFPRLSETFVLNEILGLEKLGVEIEIFSLKIPEEDRVQPAVRTVKGRVTYFTSHLPRPFRWARMFYHHALVCLANPARYRKALRFYFREQKAVRLKEFILAGLVARAVRRRRLEHIHAHFANVPAAVAEIVRVLCGVPYSFTAHAKDIYLTPVEDLRRKMRGAEFVLTCTRFNRDYLLSIGASTTPIRLVYHGVDLQMFQPPSRERVDEADPPVIVSVGRFCAKKGFPYLIEACAALRRQGRRFRCRIIGYGPLRDELAALIAANGLEDLVSLEGPFTQDQILDVYRAATVFVLPCIVTDNGDRDGIPNVLLEAMSMGVPVVSTGVSGISELIEHMTNGLLVPERDADDVAAAIELLLDRPELRRCMAENGRRRVLENFEMEASARSVRDAFQTFRFPEESEALLDRPKEVAIS
jgi:glycosyltransferase involved in cell wall biosynthesis